MWHCSSMRIGIYVTLKVLDGSFGVAGDHQRCSLCSSHQSDYSTTRTEFKHSFVTDQLRRM